jgi:Uri superfamily endonuclease
MKSNGWDLESLHRTKGTYCLLLQLGAHETIQIGRLGLFKFQAGHYIYFGSALGPGGLASRIRHHLRIAAKPHWHVDYLRRHAIIEAIGYIKTKTLYEHRLADYLNTLNNWHAPIKGFGASDCKCNSHLFFSCAKPDLIQLMEGFKLIKGHLFELPTIRKRGG